MRINGLCLHYLDFGNTAQSPAEDARPVMLCLHGGAAQAHWFDFVVGAFLENYRVLSLDLRGHGDSEWGPMSDYSYEHYANDVGCFIQTLRLGPVLLTGHSMGGMVSLVTTTLFPGEVSRLVVIDSMMRMSPERAATLRGVGQGQGRSFDNQTAFVEGFNIRPEASFASPHVVQHMAKSSCREFEDGRWRNKFDRNVYAHRHAIDGFDYWPRVTTPTLLIAANPSDRITPDVQKKVMAACAQVELKVVDNAGHHVTLDNPSGYISVLSDYLKKAQK